MIFYSILLSIWYPFSYIQDSSYSYFQIDSLVSESSVFSLDYEGNTYILDQENHKLLKFNSQNQFQKEIGGIGWGQLNFDTPVAIDASYGLNIFVSDYYNNRIQRFNRNLEFISSLSGESFQSTNIRFVRPSILAVDRFSNLYFYDSENKNIMKINFDGLQVKDVRIIGDYRLAPHPIQLALAREDNLFVLETNKISIYDSWGTLLRALQLEVPQSARAFCLSEKEIYIVTDTELVIINQLGEQLNKINIEEYFQLPSANRIADVKIFQDHLHLLTNKMILVCPTNLFLTK
ncbi:MAG: NHL repeat-containing protein [Bacteroidota bacterium]|nr:NHL repeat-containing protein [Bacteroidota bacterium]